MARTSHTNTLTTQQVADAAGVGVTTAKRWLADGLLASYALPVRGKKKTEERRVWLEDLVEFLKKNGNYRAAEKLVPGAGAINVLVLASAHPWFEQLKTVMADPKFRLHYAHVVIEAGAVCARVGPRAVVVDFNISRADAFSVSAWLQRQGQVALAALLPEDQSGSQSATALKDYGFSAWWKKPVDPAVVAEWLKAR